MYMLIGIGLPSLSSLYDESVCSIRLQQQLAQQAQQAQQPEPQVTTIVRAPIAIRRVRDLRTKM